MEARCGRNASWLALAPVAGILLITLVTQGVLKPLFGCREGGGGEFSFTCPSKVVELTAEIGVMVMLVLFCLTVITVPAGIILYFVCRRRARFRAAA
jgi:hypothetical protein